MAAGLHSPGVKQQGMAADYIHPAAELMGMTAERDSPRHGVLGNDGGTTFPITGTRDAEHSLSALMGGKGLVKYFDGWGSYLRYIQ